MTGTKTYSSNSSGEKSGNTRQISPSKHWCFTLNNHTAEDISSIVNISSAIVPKYVFQEEQGCDKGVVHLQGYLKFHEKVRPKSVTLLPTRIHWEKCRNIQQSILYCQKEESRYGQQYFRGIIPTVPMKLIDPTYAWEQAILQILKYPPDERTIYWYWGDCNIGKTSFCKYLTATYGAIALSGKGADMRNGVLDYLNNKKTHPRLVLINIPKTFDMNYISYEGIENVKDMYFYSGKYEGGQVCGPNPHLFIFANEPPSCDTMASDRWVIRKI